MQECDTATAGTYKKTHTKKTPHVGTKLGRRFERETKQKVTFLFALVSAIKYLVEMSPNGLM